MSWIESHQSLLSHRKTLRLAGLMKADRYKAIGHLHALWWWGLDNADIDGCLSGISALEIAVAAGWPEKSADAFVSALVTAGFVDDRDGELWLHDWYDYAGKLNERRRKERERSAQRRSQPQDVAQTTGGQPAVGTQDDQQTTVGTVPNQPYLPNQPTEGSNDPSSSKRGKRASKPPPNAVQPSETRYLTEEDLVRYEAENPTIRIRAMAQDYIDWQARLPPTHAQKHSDQIRGFDNQLAEQWRCDKFRKLGVTGNGRNSRGNPNDAPVRASGTGTFAAFHAEGA